jgi:DNA-3-methyladenine glycosylase I
MLLACFGALRTEGIYWRARGLDIQSTAELICRHPAMVNLKSDCMKVRCAWCTADPLYIRYHDEEWGVPVHDDRMLFEMLILEGAQAGLSWFTILKRRESYREAFDHFEAKKIARYDAKKTAALLANAGIIRNRLKIAAAVGNAQAFLAAQKEYGTFDRYIWSFVGGKPKRNRWKTLGQIPARSVEAEAMSRDLKKRGFRFVGPTICYAFMQAVGMVDDHMTECFRAKAR